MRISDWSSDVCSSDLLRHDAEQATCRAKIAHGVVAEHADGALGGVDQAGNDADQRRLAGAVRPQQCEEFAAAALETDAAQGFKLSVPLADTADPPCAGRGGGRGGGCGQTGKTAS